MARESVHSRLRGLAAFVLFAVIAAGLAAYLHLSLPNIPDRDALYHFRHAALYVERGPLMSEFPWTSCSVVSRFQADIWYGFHALLTPFTFARDPVRGVKLAGAFSLTALLLLFYSAMRRSRMHIPFLWPLLVLAFVPFSLYRQLMTRPHVLTMGLAALLLSCTVGGSLWGIAMSSFAIAWLHLSFFWVIPLVVVVTAFVKRLTEEVWLWREAIAAGGGLLAGWLLRPNPIGAAKLAYIQVIQLAFEKQKGVELLFGGDLLSGLESMERHSGDFVRQFAPAIILCAAAAIALVAGLAHQAALSPRQKTFLWTSLALSAGAFAMMMQFSIRAVDLWNVFAVAFVAGVFSFVIRPGAHAATGFSTPRQLAVMVGLGTLFLAFMLWRGFDEHVQRMPKLGYSPYRFKAAADWLRENSGPGEIVFHSHWDLFPDLFFWNTHNRYIGGMDPIFQYAYDEGLYWKAHHLYSGRFASYTCSTPSCGPALGEDTCTVLQRDFRASYLLVEKPRFPLLQEYASSDDRFSLVLEDDAFALFRLRSADRSQPDGST